MQLHRHSLRQLWRRLSRPLREGIRSWSDGPKGPQGPLTLPAIAKKPGTRILVMIAHPGDEQFCGGLLAALKDQGAEIAIHCLTRGEGSDTKDIPRDRLGSVRERELRAAMEVIGVNRISFGGYIDPLPRPPWHPVPQFLPQKLKADLLSQIQSFDPDWIISHGPDGEGGTPAHIWLHLWLKRAMQDKKKQANRVVPILTFNANHPRYPWPYLLNDEPVRLELDVSRWQTQRRLMLAKYVSQADAFARISGTESPDAFVTNTTTEFFGVWGA
jgi:LmbE family N-acetylglucosaminyl deacetylase